MTKYFLRHFCVLVLTIASLSVSFAMERISNDAQKEQLTLERGDNFAFELFKFLRTIAQLNYFSEDMVNDFSIGPVKTIIEHARNSGDYILEIESWVIRSAMAVSFDGKLIAKDGNVLNIEKNEIIYKF